MKTIGQILLGTTVAMGIASGALAQATHGGPGAASAPAAMPNSMPGPSDTPSTKEFKEADSRMMQDMDVPYTGNPDADFRSHMIPHHQGAIAMAKVALKYAKDPDTKKMAADIIKAQEAEIADMQAWLKKHGH